MQLLRCIIAANLKSITIHVQVSDPNSHHAHIRAHANKLNCLLRSDLHTCYESEWCSRNMGVVVRSQSKCEAKSSTSYSSEQILRRGVSGATNAGCTQAAVGEVSKHGDDETLRGYSAKAHAMPEHVLHELGCDAQCYLY